ncbi:uncharacterized protein L3040_003555 [Drepanopeziza brunnea f. sp. 'multigermtubi']|uniref:RTA1 domain protein n=1 Tax=Marssonina brunnea f. sp. multigermtubi (strain MB_m1) TaxID=1072389 RepID=K1XAH6_MARBU|nr:putative protein RTA1 [Drepanopeziza brunnea f. sp. 'multigermtubi' MB_m1]EKD17673.1 putative protein RTA1 [Drepanopeziza brunnea f. sp. 'multigermtubi' MB_m1]KAJ5046308.1 hypothetical protein L3040_003555 [Drepanopeziza brunnea f. sp. 'multigermtubi']
MAPTLTTAALAGAAAILVARQEVNAAGEESNFKHYTPSKALALAFAALFGASSIWHTWTMIKRKAWLYTAFVCGGWMMTIGFIGRYMAANDVFASGPYIIQALFLILPPSLYAATIYMMYGRIVVFVEAPEASLIRPKWVTKIFVTGDLLAFVMQGGGGGLTASDNPDTAMMGQDILMAGLVAQLIFFCFFLLISLVFWKRMRSSPTYYSMPKYGKYSWQQLLKLLLAAAAIIIFRCVFRIIEFSQGDDGALMKKEWYIYAGDFAPMLFVQCAFHWMHTQDVFPPGGVSGKTASEGGEFVELGQRASR